MRLTVSFARAHPCHSDFHSNGQNAPPIGTANTPALIEVRTDDGFAADARIIPGAIRTQPPGRPAKGGKEFVGRAAIDYVTARGRNSAPRSGGLA